MIAGAAALAAAGGGVLCLHVAWRRGGAPWRALAGWLLIGAGAAAWRAAGVAWDTAVAYAVLALSLAGLSALAIGVRWRRGASKSRGAPAKDASDAAGSPWRAITRTILAGPGAGLAALGLTALVALRAPWGEADRLVAAGLLLPAAWAAGGVWALMDAKIGRVGVGLAIAAAATFAGARL